MVRSGLCALALAGILFASGMALAEDVVVVIDGDRMEDAADEGRRIGRKAAREGKRIARDATEYAEDIADEFVEAFDD